MCVAKSFCHENKYYVAWPDQFQTKLFSYKLYDILKRLAVFVLILKM